MRYKYLSILVVIFTFISVTSMLFCKDIIANVKNITAQLHTKDTETVDEKSTAQEEGKAINLKETRKRPVTAEANTDTEKQVQNNEEEKLGKENETNINTSTKDVTSEKSADNNEEDERYKKATEANDDYPDTAAVFKVSANQIVKEISTVDKIKLFAIAEKISPMDYARINNYFKDNNEGRGITKIFALLKTRLSDKDYEKIKDIANKYIDVDKVESYIK